MHPLIEANRSAIADLCRRHGVRRLEVFGSILSQDFDAASSDVDVLVEYAPDGGRSFADFLDLKEALEQLFRRPVDLIEPHTIRNRRLRHYIERDKSLIYEAA